MESKTDEKYQDKPNAEIDEKDRAILAELRRDGGLSEQKLAKKTGIPMTTVHNRLVKLKRNNVITQYTVRLDFAKLGQPITAYVLVKAAPQADQQKLMEHIATLPNIFEVAMITGEFDILVKARVASMTALNELIVQNLRKQKAVNETRTLISYKTEELSGMG
ncbi:Lrp/AsnC family transcriptional regulator [Candidatus Micrarchaeota archaeon]|nr:Lrp/AsnC family transcriptional regulator [Candidatus Micrarchaeota archaeon]